MSLTDGGFEDFDLEAGVEDTSAIRDHSGGPAQDDLSPSQGDCSEAYTPWAFAKLPSCSAIDARVNRSV